MEQHKNAQDLGNLVASLEEMRNEATSCSIVKTVVSISAASLSSGFLYGAAKLVSATAGSRADDFGYYLAGLGGSLAAVSLLTAVSAALDRYRSQSLKQRILELKQSPEYLAQQETQNS